MNTSLGQTGNDLDSAEPMNSEKKNASHCHDVQKQIPNIPNMKRHENHSDKSLVAASLRTEGRAHRRNKFAS